MKFGFTGFVPGKDKPEEDKKDMIICKSGHGHCWQPGPTLLLNPPIYTYRCVHCAAYKKEYTEAPKWCKFD